MGEKGCPGTSVGKYRYSLRNNPEERRSHLLRGGSLKSRAMSHENKINPTKMVECDSNAYLKRM